MVSNQGAIIYLQIHIAKYTIWKQQSRDKTKLLPEDSIQKNTAEFKRTHLLCHKKMLIWKLEMIFVGEVYDTSHFLQTHNVNKEQPGHNNGNGVYYNIIH